MAVGDTARPTGWLSVVTPGPRPHPTHLATGTGVPQHTGYRLIPPLLSLTGRNEIRTVRRYTAELIGTFVLVFGGVGTAVLAGDKVGYLGVAFAFGLTLLTLAYALGPVPGCHINPAVTVGFLVARKISPRDAAGYVTAHLLGGIAAAALLLVVAKSLPGGYDATVKGLGSNGYGAHSPTGYHLGGVVVVEVR